MVAAWALAAVLVLAAAQGAHGYNETLGDGAPTEKLTTRRDESKFFTFTLPAVRTALLSWLSSITQHPSVFAPLESCWTRASHACSSYICTVAPPRTRALWVVPSLSSGAQVNTTNKTSVSSDNLCVVVALEVCAHFISSSLPTHTQGNDAMLTLNVHDGDAGASRTPRAPACCHHAYMSPHLPDTPQQRAPGSFRAIKKSPSKRRPNAFSRSIVFLSQRAVHCVREYFLLGGESHRGVHYHHPHSHPSSLSLPHLPPHTYTLTLPLRTPTHALPLACTDIYVLGPNYASESFDPSPSYHTWRSSHAVGDDVVFISRNDTSYRPGDYRVGVWGWAQRGSPGWGCVCAAVALPQKPLKAPAGFNP
jgi:hypothetical protein